MKPAPTLAQLYARSQDAVAYVQTQKGSGSGFLVSKNGQIVTNEHVVDGASRVTVRFGEHGKALPARVVGQDATDDLAVLDVADSAVAKITPLTLGSSSGLRVGQSAIAIGSPFGLSGTLTSGVVSALGRDIQSPNGHTISGVVPDRRGDQPRQLRRPAARRDRPGDRDQLPDRDRVGLQQRRRLRDPGRHRPPGADEPRGLVGRRTGAVAGPRLVPRQRPAVPEDVVDGPPR
jgi:hypothetical protein